MKTTALILLPFLILSSCSQSTPVSTAVEKALTACDEQQKTIDMALIPNCYLKILSTQGYSKVDAKKIIRQRTGVDIDAERSDSSAWQEAWDKNYP